MSRERGFCFARAAADGGTPVRYGRLWHRARGEESNDSGSAVREAEDDEGRLCRGSMVRRLLRPWKPSTRDGPLPRASSGVTSRYSSSSNSSVIMGDGPGASARVPSRSSTTFSRGAAKVTLLRFIRGGGGVGVRFMLDVLLLDGKQSEESRATSKS
jgi:hypothetical protein